MYVKKLKIENFRGIRNMELELHRRMNVFIGVNGAGKSSVLDALGYLFVPFVQYACDLRHSEMDRNCFPEFEIHGCETKSLLELVIARKNLQDLVCSMRSSRAMGNAPLTTPYLRITPDNWEPYFCFSDLTETKAGVIVYFSARRVGDKVPIAAWMKRSFRKGDAFLDALNQKVDFKEFFEWFRNREDLENEERAEGINEHDRQLEAVRKVIGTFCGALENPRVRRRDPLRMVVTKNNQELRIEQLSEGEKCLLAMVGDLARRLAIANPYLENPLDGEGVVLIDEVDLHLHPQWQRMILPRLMETFPNCQFIVSTHSPQILGEVKSEHIIRLEDTRAGIEAFPANGETFGLTSNEILERQMETSERNMDIQEMIEEAFLSVERGNLDRAKELKTELAKTAKNIPELVSLDMRISRKEVTGK